MIRDARVILFVGDPTRSRAFYAAVLAEAPTLDVPGMTEFRLGPATHLGLMPAGGIERLLGGAVRPSATPSATRAELYLTVDDPGAYVARALAAGAVPASPLQARGWGDDVAYCVDPDGHLLAFARPTGAVVTG